MSNKRSIAQDLEDFNVAQIQGMNFDYPDLSEDFGKAIIKEDEHKTNGEAFTVTFIELAMLNKFFHTVYRSQNKDIVVKAYGDVSPTGSISFGGPFDNTQSWWFLCNLTDDENDYYFQTQIFRDNRQEIITQLHITVKNGVSVLDLDKIFKKIVALAFNNSEYVGKCIKVKIKDGRFKGIEVIEFDKVSTELILNETQLKYINHFIHRVERGGNARYLLNGEPGTGKTQSIRDIIRALESKVTFIIPDFNSSEDLTIILEACEIFNKGVIIMDDIDLYLGSRDKGSYTRLLGEFLSFFDGVKKRKISLLASTNDKGLVDKAAERPGRFNMTLDYTFLTSEQIVSVCKIHLPLKYQVEDVYKALQGRVDGKEAKITGAFIANLADNIKEMSEGDDTWTMRDTIALIDESYRGFYLSQVEKNKNRIGFKIDNE